jgi:hypothetical protein
MATIVLTAAEFARYHKKLGRSIKPALMRGIYRGADKAREYLQKRTRKAPPANPAGIGKGGAVDTGNYLQRWRWVKRAWGVVLFNDHPAAKVIEFGRRVGAKQPPPQALMPWAIRKLSQFKVLRASAHHRRKAGPLTRTQVKRFARRQANARTLLKSVVFLIGRAIKRRGLLPRRILTDETANAKIRDLFRREALRELRALNRIFRGEAP